VGAGARAQRGRGEGKGVGCGGEGMAAARRRVYGSGGAESERVREKEGYQPYLHVLCRVPVIWHSAKIFFLILKYALPSARSLALDKVVFAECPLVDTRQRLFYYSLSSAT
jgi:hypothetical protein